MVTDPTRALEWMIGLPGVAFLGAEDSTDGMARIHVETTASLVGCPRCGVLARVKDRSTVELVDLPLFGARPAWCGTSAGGCVPTADCAMGSWTEEDDRIAAPRQVLTARVGSVGDDPGRPSCPQRQRGGPRARL